jgi:hypothetical protein
MFKRKAQQSLIITLFALGALSCPLEYVKGWRVLGSGEFYAVNASTGSSYVLKADLLWTGNHCTVWAEQSSNSRVTAAVAEDIAREFDYVIYPKMINTFSFTPSSESRGKNAMEYADWLGNGDGKLAILLLDIQDGHNAGGGYVAGYFSESDFIQNANYPSNRMDVIYIDTYPGLPGSLEFNATIAHEILHMMSYAGSKVFGLSDKDTWIGEGLATAAEYVYLSAKGAGHPGNRYEWYNAGGDSLARGNNFFVWANHASSPNSSLDDYATTYLFFQWLRIQSEKAGVKDIYKRIMASNDTGYKAVTEAASLAMPGKDYGNWGTLLKTWLAANYINAASGAYGYWGDPELKNIKVTGAPKGAASLELAPGEGVYSGIPSNYIHRVPSSTTNGIVNIKYAGLKKSPESLTDAPGAGDKVLLTFNANTTGEHAETGMVTGTALPVEGTTEAAWSRSAVGDSLSGPFPMDIRDILARNGHGTDFE